MSTHKRTIKRWIPYLLLSPIFVCLSIFLFYPTAKSIYMSFFDINLLASRSPLFIGFKNYISALKDQKIIHSFFVTMVFTASAVGLEFSLGLGAALLLDYLGMKGRIIQSIALTPMVIMPTVVGLMWRFLWSTDWGIINYTLSLVGISRVNWLGESSTALFAIIITEVWNQTPFATLILFAALKSLPTEPFEVARIDGASRVQIFRYITLPLLTPAIGIVLLFRTIYVLRLFSTIYTLTGGGPGRATSVISIFIYLTSFRYFEAGYGSAISVLLLLISIIIGLVYLRYFYAKLEI